MKLEITAITINGQNEKQDKFKAEMYSGENIDTGCLDTRATEEYNAVSRYKDILKRGHNSIADHYMITVLITGITKIVAMVLSSLGDCYTSEQPVSLTKMDGNSKDEVKLYNKWVVYLEPMIKKLDYGLNAGEAHRLAVENARYMLSVFTPSTDMSYTASIRKWNYIIDWCHKLYASDIEDNHFNRALKEYLNEFANQLSALVYIDELRDYKDGALWFLANQTKSTWMGFNESRIRFEESYQTIYKGTFTQLAQTQGHRTTELFMLFNGESKEFFVPYIIRGTKFEDIWLADIRSVACVVPQGTLIDIVETGTTDNFLLQSYERLCGRAQLEICKQTEEILQQMRIKGTFNAMLRKRVENFFNPDGSVKARCQLLNGCSEPCTHGAGRAITRII